MKNEKDPRAVQREGQIDAIQSETTNEGDLDSKANSTGSEVNDPIEFLKMFRPGGPWVLTSIVPDGRITTVTFREDQTDNMKKWLAAKSGHENLYFTVNSTGEKNVTKKPRKNDIVAAEWLHVDVDPAPELDLDVERKRILKALQDINPSPTIIVDSGGGYQAFWKMATVDVSTEEARTEIEDTNRWLEKQLGGDHCHNIDRIMRLPGTINVPNKKKRSTGRSPSEAQVVKFDHTQFDLSEFGRAPSENSVVVNVDVGEPRPVTLAEMGTLPDSVRYVAVNMEHPSNGPYTDRSAGVWFLVSECARNNVDPELAQGLLLDRELKVSEHIYDQKNPVRYARNQVEKAYRNSAERGTALRIGLANQNLEQALPLLQDNVFRRGQMAVRLSHATDEQEGVRRDGGVVMVQATPSWTFLHVAKSKWVRPTKDGDVLHDPPRNLGRDIVENVERLRPLRAIINAPTLTWDGRLLTGRGWQEGLWLDIDDHWPALETNPKQAIKQLMSPFELMMYVSDTDRSVAASALLCALMRTQMATRPAHIFDATVAGSGKTMHANVVGIVAQGHAPAHVAQAASEEEMEKRLVAVLRAGDGIVSFDNCTYPVEGAQLASMLTSSVARCRILGSSDTIDIPNEALMLFTGNGMQVSGDIHRRAAICRIDPQCERPELRKFDWTPDQRAHEERRQIVMAGLGLIQSYISAGRPGLPPAIGSFEDWTTIRGALMWVGLPDPADSTASLVEDDPERTALERLATLWPGKQTVGKVLDKIAEDHIGQSALWHALQEFTGEDNPTARSIGRRLRTARGRWVAGQRLTSALDRTKTHVWWFETPKNQEEIDV